MQYIYLYIYIEQVFAGIALNHLLSWYRHAVCSLSLHVLKQGSPLPRVKALTRGISFHRRLQTIVSLKQALSLSLSSLNRRDGFLPGYRYILRV